MNISERDRGTGDGTRDIRYVDSKDFFDNLDFDKEIKGTGTRGSQLRITRRFFSTGAGFWTPETTLVETSREDTPFLEADL